MKNLILFLIFPILTVYSQNQTKLLGTWELIKEEPKESEIVMFELEGENPEETIQDLIIQFNTNGNVDTRQGEIGYYGAKFTLTDSILKLGNQKYLIIKISKNELILKDYEGLFQKTTYYQRISERIKSTPEKENFVQTFENGNIKITGQKLYGFQNGKWIEYYENGNIKSEKYFDNAIPIGIWKYYDENGKLLRKENK